jgi:hypothetical protein
MGGFRVGVGAGVGVGDTELVADVGTIVVWPDATVGRTAGVGVGIGGGFVGVGVGHGFRVGVGVGVGLAVGVGLTVGVGLGVGVGFGLGVGVGLKAGVGLGAAGGVGTGGVSGLTGGRSSDGTVVTAGMFPACVFSVGGRSSDVTTAGGVLDGSLAGTAGSGLVCCGGCGPVPGDVASVSTGTPPPTPPVSPLNGAWFWRILVSS